MLRLALLVMLVTACEPRLIMKPLPELVVREAPVTALHVSELMLIPGESMVWDVRWHGLTVGRAELVVGEHDVESRFNTGKLVSSVAKAHHSLTTQLDREAARPRQANELLELDGKTAEYAPTFGAGSYALGDRRLPVPKGNTAHTLHSAIGLLRAWARPDANPGFIFIVHVGELYRFEIGQPLVENLQGKQTLRIQCVAYSLTSKAAPISITVWLANSDRTPIRMEIESEGEKATAELVDSSS